MIRRIPSVAFVMALAFGFAVAQPALASSPSLGGISPRGMERGKTVELTFSGGRLTDAKSLLFYTPGLRLVGLKVVNDATVKATVEASPSCTLGEHPVRVLCASGISELRTFWVGPFPTIDEKEPNSEFTKPQVITPGVTIHGVVDNEDVDYYSVVLKKGQRLSAEIEGMRLGGTLFDPYIAILDTKRFELVANDDTPLLGQDAMVSMVAPEDGTYLVQVRESAYGGNGACTYRLHVGHFPRPTAVVPAGGKAGEEIEVTFIGDPTGPFKQKIRVPSEVDANFRLHPADAQGIAPSGFLFRISPTLGNVVEVEPNDTPGTASPASLTQAFHGVVGQLGDIDNFKFAGKKGQVFDVHCYARRLGSPLDSVMTLLVFGGGVIASADDAIGPDSYFRVTLPEDKEYILTIQDHLKKGGPNFFYRVEMTAVAPGSTASIPKVAQYSQERQTLSVPKNGRVATLVTVGRRDWGGDLNLTADKLPAGVKMIADMMPGNLDTIPVVFEATPTATPDSTLAKITGTPADPKVASLGAFNINAELIIGNNQAIFYKVDQDRAAINVTDELPFKVSVVESKAPLVQNGSMNLKIVSERKPGFTGPITIYPLFNPPGMSTAGSATIAEKQNETTILVSAAPNAQIKKWRTAFLATATVGNGPVWTSTQLATIDIAAPFFAMTMERGSCEQGKETDIFCKLTTQTPFDGKATVTIVGLPPKVVTGPLEFAKDSKEIGFHLKVDKTAPAGTHRNIFCQATVMVAGEPVLHNIGGTELRIDVPLPPKPMAVAVVKPMAVAVAVVKPVEKPPEKRLTRLEKLRLEQDEREKQDTAVPKK